METKNKLTEERGNGKEKRKKKLIRLICFVAFFLIFIFIFLRVTYILRNDNYDSAHITAFKAEEDMDMVYIGSSATFVFWEAPRAYGEYGITSYDYATNAAPAETIKGSMREVLKSKSPELFVIDLRPFRSWDKELDEGGIRGVTDAMNYSPNRFLTVHDALSRRTLGDDTNIASYYFDIIKYHTETNRLTSAEYLENWNNARGTPWSGWEFITAHETLNTPENAQTEESGNLADGCRETLIDLLEFCQKKDLTVLFVVSPYCIPEEQWAQFNTMRDLIESYGFDYLNANSYYDEMGLDWSTDFYNKNHVNCFGAEKYTRFLAEYIQDNYHLADHRNDADTKTRDTQWEAFCEEDAQVKSDITALMEEKQTAYEEGQALKEIRSPDEWAQMTQNDNYTVFLAETGDPWISNTQADAFLSLWGLSTETMRDAMRIGSGEEVLYDSDESLDENYADAFTTHTDSNPEYEINSGAQCTIQIDGEEYAPDGEGLHLVVWDNNYREVLDSVLIVQDETGELVLER